MKTAMMELIEYVKNNLSEPSNGTEFIRGYDDALNSLLHHLSTYKLLEKEKEQIAKSYDKGTIHSTRLGKFMDGNDYFTQTYTQTSNQVK